MCVIVCVSNDNMASNDEAALKAARFTQEKLESYYEDTCRRLWPWRDTIDLVQEVLTWKKPLLSLVLYITVHWTFYHFAMQDLGVISIILTLGFFVVVCDILWRLATAKGQGSKKLVSQPSRSDSRMDIIPLEHAMVDYHTPLSAGELLPFSSICVLVSNVLLWVDMTYIAVVMKFRESPSVVALATIAMGILLLLVAKVMPPIVLAYLIVIGLLSWPYMECHHVWSNVMSRVRPWLEQVDLEAIKKKIVREETEEEYAFAIDESMTAEAFGRALGVKVISRPSSKTNLSTIPEQPGPPPKQGYIPQSFDEHSLDPHYDSLVADLAYGIDDMPSITSELGAIEEEGGRDMLDLGEGDHTHIPSAGRPQPRKRRKLPKRPHPQPHPDSGQYPVMDGRGGGVQSPLAYTTHQPHPGSLATTPITLAQGGVYHSTPLASDVPPSYDEVLASEGTADYASYYRENPSNDL